MLPSVEAATAQQNRGSAASDETIPGAGEAARADDAPNSASGGIFGVASERRRVIPGLWGMHFFDRQSLELFWTRGGGIQYGGWYGGAFMNSYDDLSLIAGLERDWYRARLVGLEFGVGYRIGLLTGYDGQLIDLADKTPVLPFAGPHVWLQKGPLGVDAFYVYRALAFEASIGY